MWAKLRKNWRGWARVMARAYHLDPDGNPKCHSDYGCASPLSHMQPPNPDSLPLTMLGTFLRGAKKSVQGKKPRVTFFTNAERNMMSGSHLICSLSNVKFTFPHKPVSSTFPTSVDGNVGKQQFSWNPSDITPLARWSPKLVKSTFHHFIPFWSSSCGKVNLLPKI